MMTNNQQAAGTTHDSMKAKSLVAVPSRADWSEEIAALQGSIDLWWHNALDETGKDGLIEAMISVIKGLTGPGATSSDTDSGGDGCEPLAQAIAACIARNLGATLDQSRLLQAARELSLRFAPQLAPAAPGFRLDFDTTFLAMLKLPESIRSKLTIDDITQIKDSINSSVAGNSSPELEAYAIAQDIVRDMGYDCVSSALFDLRKRVAANTTQCGNSGRDILACTNEPYAPSDDDVVLPPTPTPICIHPQLGELFDRFQMHSYAIATASRPITKREELWRGIFKVLEESGEFLQILGKLGAFPVEQHPDGKGPLIDRLHDEAADLRASLTYFATENGLDEARLNGRETHKLSLFRQWVLSGIPVALKTN